MSSFSSRIGKDVDELFSPFSSCFFTTTKDDRSSDDDAV
jgi:hypothetical protein